MNSELVKKISLIIVFVLIIFSVTLFFYQQKSCDTMDFTDASIEVLNGDYKSIGFNLNQESLTFGTVSSGSIVERSMYANYSQKAKVKVLIEGDLSSWIIIKPQKFKIEPGKTEEVKFTVNVPLTAETGNYSGKVVFCYLDQ